MLKLIKSLFQSLIAKIRQKDPGWTLTGFIYDEDVSIAHSKDTTYKLEISSTRSKKSKKVSIAHSKDTTQYAILKAVESYTFVSIAHSKDTTFFDYVCDEYNINRKKMFQSLIAKIRQRL